MWRKHTWYRIWSVAVLLCCFAGAVLPRALAQEDSPGQADRGGGLPAGSQMVRGTVVGSAADAVSVKTETGEIIKVTVTPNTRVMKARQPVKLTEVRAGDGVGAMGVMDAPTKTLHAVFVTVVDAEQIKRAQADMGKTYIAGEVTAMEELKLTIRRADGVSQTIAVDEGTSFRRGGRGMGMMGGGAPEAGAGGGGTGASGAQRGSREGSGGESITLADVKVGDTVIGRGALKGGMFVPTELRVLDRAARGRRRGAVGPDGASGGGSAPAVVPPSGVQ